MLDLLSDPFFLVLVKSLIQKSHFDLQRLFLQCI
jgi:hypothetical protein